VSIVYVFGVVVIPLSKLQAGVPVVLTFRLGHQLDHSCDLHVEESTSSEVTYA
jgi:hypothetical protein